MIKRDRYRNDGRYPREEINLWCGVIRTAIIDYRRNCENYQNRYQGNRYRAVGNDAAHWLFKSAYRGPGSLRWICDLLGMDVNAVRSKAVTCDLNAIAAYQRAMEARQ